MAKTKVLSKLPRRKKKAGAPSRITNDTVAEHRERILAGGRRFKYPVQYARHKLVINAVVISLVALLLLLVIGWWQLYLAQNSSAFMYRITRIVPLPVASVDGESARYSDYLLNYRTSEHYLSRFDEIKPDSEDGRLQLQYKKRDALDIAIKDAYARKIAKERGVSVSQEEVDDVLSGLRQAANGELTEETSNASSQRVLGLSPDDLELLVKNSILRTKVAFAVDEEATKAKDAAQKLLQQHGGDFEKTAAELKAQGFADVAAGISGFVNTSSTYAGSGIRASKVAELQVGGVSPPLQSTTDSGYYFFKVVEKNDTQVNFQSLHIPLTQFRQNIETLKKDNKVSEYITITIDQTSAPNTK